jgi:hypothetical protein
MILKMKMAKVTKVIANDIWNPAFVNGTYGNSMTNFDFCIIDDCTKETPRKRLRALQAVLKILVESPCLQDFIDVNWVKKPHTVGQSLQMRNA